jgi:hypothetical protein
MKSCVDMIRNFVISFLFSSAAFVYADDSLYTETFDNNGDVNVVGWVGVYASGSNGGVSSFAWVWHSGICGNLIYTNKFTVDTNTCPNIKFRFDLRAHSFYLHTPDCSIAVRVNGVWYVSKTVFTSVSTSFSTENYAYHPDKRQWDLLDIEKLTRGSTAPSVLAGDITAFGLYSNSGNAGGSCTAEYDNFQIVNSTAGHTQDSNAGGK